MITVTISGPQGHGKTFIAETIHDILNFRKRFTDDNYKIEIFDGMRVPKNIKCDVLIVTKQEK